MRRTVSRFVLCGLLILALLLFGLSACSGTVGTSGTPTETASPTETAPVMESAPVTETSPVTETTKPSTVPAARDILWPELDGFTLKTDNSAMATYNVEKNPNVGMIAMVAMSGSEAPLDIFQGGWSEETEAFLSDSGMLPGAVIAHEKVSLPLLSQEGIGLTLDVQGVHMQVLYFISQDQLIQVQGYGMPGDKDVVEAACDQFASRVSLV